MVSKTTKKRGNEQGTQEGDGYDEADHPGHIPASALAALAFVPVLVHGAPSYPGPVPSSKTARSPEPILFYPEWSTRGPDGPPNDR